MLTRRLGTQLNRTLRSFARSASTSTPEVPVATTAPAPSSAAQSPNHDSTWSTNQLPRPTAGTAARFQQAAMELQPNPLSAMELVANEPVRTVHGRKAECDGGMCPNINVLPWPPSLTTLFRRRAAWASQNLYQSCMYTSFFLPQASVHAKIMLFTSAGSTWSSNMRV